MCDCKFTPYPEGDEDFGEESIHYLRTCEFCSYRWWSLHCPHDGYQNSCPQCERHPTVVLDPASPSARKSLRAGGWSLRQEDIDVQLLEMFERGHLGLIGEFMSMFPSWFGLQKQTVPQSDTTCKNCRRRYVLAVSPDACPYCGYKPMPQKVSPDRKTGKSK